MKTVWSIIVFWLFIAPLSAFSQEATVFESIEELPQSES
jgi:hypothetical protein